MDTDKPESPLIKLLRKHHREAPSQLEFIRAVCNRCNVAQSTVYQWLSGPKFPSGENTINLIDFLRERHAQKQEPQTQQ